MKRRRSSRLSAKPLRIEVPTYSPGYMPVSPTYSPTSPGYEPVSPGYLPYSPGYEPVSSSSSAPSTPTYSPLSDETPPPDDAASACIQFKQSVTYEAMHRQYAVIEDMFLAYKRKHPDAFSTHNALKALYGTMINARFYHDDVGIVGMSMRVIGGLCHALERDGNVNADGYGYLDYYCSTGYHVVDATTMQHLRALGFTMNAADYHNKTTLECTCREQCREPH